MGYRRRTGRARLARADPKADDHPNRFLFSRGGFTSNIHLSADGRCRPLSLIVTPGRRGDYAQLVPAPEKGRVPASDRGGAVVTVLRVQGVLGVADLLEEVAAEDGAAR
ncbi:hypothetical protein ACIPSA_48265 [Streptomyces sp. NPDC086549]|uniref:hypothetical protein n=1 Tax=Streptomyces sp. NPDC086549 TaxID=3365752 RepID=UPI003829BC9A